ITHIKKAQLPFVVAINKIDKPTASPQKVLQDLAKNEVLVEGQGGDVPTVKLSAKTGQGIDELLEMILLLAEMAELKYDPQAPASGVVIESNLDPQKG
ncbi:MAG: translation initiation factor IF-2-like protein, partial [Candidatus Portnoybacteria bacterium CG10_big_fil_rev_8_21_14_0_10_44_7]